MYGYVNDPRAWVVKSMCQIEHPNARGMYLRPSIAPSAGRPANLLLRTTSPLYITLRDYLFHIGCAQVCTSDAKSSFE